MKSANKTTRREALNKYVRAKAHREGTLFKDALENVVVNENGTGAFVPVIAGRWRADSKRWETRERLRVERIVKAPAYDASARCLTVDKEEDSRSEIISATHSDMSIPIMTIARPTKRRGANKGFEMVNRNFSVIALPENTRSLPGDDDWERIDDEEAKDSRPSYSSVLRTER